jgi:hypothetical protein
MRQLSYFTSSYFGIHCHIFPKRALYFSLGWDSTSAHIYMESPRVDDKDEFGDRMSIKDILAIAVRLV